MNQTIDRDNLIGSSLAIESMSYILQDIQDKYFQKLNADEETDTFNIIYDFNRYKAKMYAIEVLLNIVIREFRENKLIE